MPRYQRHGDEYWEVHPVSLYLRSRTQPKIGQRFTIGKKEYELVAAHWMRGYTNQVLKFRVVNGFHTLTRYYIAWEPCQRGGPRYVDADPSSYGLLGKCYHLVHRHTVPGYTGLEGWEHQIEVETWRVGRPVAEASSA